MYTFTSVTALWLPSVVGDQDCVFMATVISTLVTKIFFLILAVYLAFTGHQQSVFQHPIFLWCEHEEDWEPESLAGNITLCSFDQAKTNLTSCFDNSVCGKQKLRVCDSEEEEYNLNIGILVVSSVRSSSGYHGLIEIRNPLFQIFQILQIRK